MKCFNKVAQNPFPELIIKNFHISSAVQLILTSHVFQPSIFTRLPWKTGQPDSDYFSHQQYINLDLIQLYCVAKTLHGHYSIIYHSY